MPLNFAKPPQQLTDAVRTTLRDMAQQRQFRIATMANAPAAEIDLASAHPVYNIGLQDLLGPATLASLQQTAWRFIVPSTGAGDSAAEAHAHPETGAPHFDSVNAGPFVSGTVSALAQLCLLYTSDAADE